MVDSGAFTKLAMNAETICFLDVVRVSVAEAAV